MKQEQPSLLPKKRLSVDIDDYVFRATKSKAAMQGRPVQSVVEEILRAWVAGRLTIISDETKGQGK